MSDERRRTTGHEREPRPPLDPVGDGAREPLSENVGRAPVGLRRSPLVVVFFTVFLDLLGFGMLPVAPYYAEKFDASGLAVGLLVRDSLMQFLFAPVWGQASDRVGRRPIS